MTYQLNKNLFVENGAAVLAARTRAARLSMYEYELARARLTAPEPQPMVSKAA